MATRVRHAVANSNADTPFARKSPVTLALEAAGHRAKRPRGRDAGARRGHAAREAPRAWHYAKHVSGYLDPRADQRVSRRHVRYAQREVLWAQSGIERVRKCGRVPVSGNGEVVIKDNAGVAHYAGLATCGSIWACPVCSAKIRNSRALEISRGAGNWDKNGNAVYLLTLTMPHEYGLSLAKLVPAISDGFRSVLSGRAWVSLKKAIGVVGTIRSMEVTHGANGWHPHLHVLVFFDGHPDATGLAEFASHVQTRWKRHIVKAGFRSPNEHGVDIQRCESAEEAGVYIAKTQDGGRAVGNEISRGDMKQGRKGSRTPFEILDDFRWTGDAADLALWGEYERATRARQAITWSKGLRGLLELEAEEQTDEELAAAEVGGDDLAVIPAVYWKRIVAIPGLSSYLLDQAEAGGLARVNEVLDAHKVGQVKAGTLRT